MAEQTDLGPEGPADVIDTDFTVGQDNIQPKVGPYILDIHNPVFVISGLTIIALVAFALVVPGHAEAFSAGCGRP